MRAMTAAGQTTDAVPDSPRRRYGTLRWLPRLAAAATLAWCSWWFAEVMVGDNLHTVIPGRVYRGTQPTAALVERLVRDYGVRTVVNLRGCCTPLDWYLEEAATAQRLGLNLEDVSFSAVHLPAPGELRLLLEIFDRAEYPIYLHCRHGSDRTGMAAAMILLLQEGVSYAEARRQLGLYYAHLSLGKTAHLDRFFDLYVEWLRTTGREHAPEHFRHWVLEEYRGGWCSGAVESVQPLDAARAGRPISYRVRVRNHGRASLHFRPNMGARVHVAYRVLDAEGKGAREGRAGMLAADVPPGQPLDLTLIIDPLEPGRYYLTVDLVEESHCWFFQAGAEPWEGEILVRE